MDCPASDRARNISPTLSGSDFEKEIQFFFLDDPYLDEHLEWEDEGADGREEAEPEGGAGRHAALVHPGENSEKEETDCLSWKDQNKKSKSKLG